MTYEIPNTAAYFRQLPQEVVDLEPRELFKIVGEEVGKRWEGIATAAQAYMQTRTGDRTLILVCAQHPLANRMTPGSEFKQRLQRALDEYRTITSSGGTANIYAPGSVHRPDITSLSAAGARWLCDQDVPVENLHGDDANELYKGPRSGAAHIGVYGTCDEAFVAAQIFRDDTTFGKMTVVASRNQALRVHLHLLVNGIESTKVIRVMPLDSHHKPDSEVQTNLPSVLTATDPTMQAPNESVPNILRSLRVYGKHPQQQNTP